MDSSTIAVGSTVFAAAVLATAAFTSATARRRTRRVRDFRIRARRTAEGKRAATAIDVNVVREGVDDTWHRATGREVLRLLRTDADFAVAFSRAVGSAMGDRAGYLECAPFSPAPAKGSSDANDVPFDCAIVDATAEDATRRVNAAKVSRTKPWTPTAADCQAAGAATATQFTTLRAPNYPGAVLVTPCSGAYATLGTFVRSARPADLAAAWRAVATAVEREAERARIAWLRTDDVAVPWLYFSVEAFPAKADLKTERFKALAAR